MAKPSNDQDELRLLGLALQALRDKSGLSQADAGARMEPPLTGQAWGLYEQGKRNKLYRPDVQAAFAAALSATPELFAIERQRLLGRPDLRAIPGGRDETRTWTPPLTETAGGLIIRDRVAAGAWRMADDTDQVRPPRFPATRDPRYPYADQWLSEVEGDSVNQLGIFDGDLIHCVDAAAIGYWPTHGHVVEVERLRFGGAERELTVKQIEVYPGGVRLWPRSTNPRWAEPLELAGEEGDDTVSVRIRGLVLHSIRRLNS